MQLKKRLHVLLIWGIPSLLFVISFTIIVSCKKNIDIQRPVAFFDIFPKTGNTITDFQFDASETIIEGDDRELFYRWDWEGDRVWDLPFSRSPEISHKYTLVGVYYPVMEVKNSSGLSDRIKMEVTVKQGNSPPLPSFFIDRYNGNIKTVFSFDGSKTKDAEDSLNTLKFRWDWESDGSWDTDYLQEPFMNHIFTDTGSYRINMEVTDTAGLTAQISKRVTIDLINEMLLVDFTISPDSGTSRDIFTFDASPCRDLENNSLEFRYFWSLWDQNDVLIYDSWFSYEKVITRKFEFHEFGRKKLILTIKDKYGLLNSVTKFFQVHYDNKPPSADFWVIPKQGNINSTFYFDSEYYSTDPDEAWWYLKYRWDFDNDGIWDTPFSRLNRKIDFQYTKPGVYYAIMEIMDTGGLTDTAQLQLPITVSNGTNETDIIVHKLGTELDPVLQYYGTVKIGDQWWMSENLNIDNVAFNAGPDDFGCYYECYREYYLFTSYLTGTYGNQLIYGGMYRISDLMILKFGNVGYHIPNCRQDENGNYIPCPRIYIQSCPENWHISTTEDWNQLINYLGPDAANELKPGGSSDFYALYGGEGLYELFGSEYKGLEEYASFAVMDYSRVFTTPETNVFQIFKNGNEIVTNSGSIFSRYSVRCVKDN